MRIVVVARAFPVLSQTFVLDHITGLIDLGQDVRIVSLAGRPTEEALVHPAVDDYRLLERTTFLDPPRSLLGALRAAPEALAGLRRARGAGAPLRMDLMRKHWGLPHPSALICAERLSAVLADADLVHAHFGPSALACLPATSALGIPLLTTFHGYDVHTYPAREGATCYRRLFQYGSLFLTNTEDTRRRVIELGGSPDRILVHHQGTSMDGMRVAPREDRAGEVTSLLTVGRLVEFKGHPYAIRAVAQLIERGHKLRYRIVGDGPLRAELQGLIDTLGVHEHITLLGSRQKSDVLDLYDEADLFVLASITTSEGRVEAQGLVVQEAQACGLPVVVTDNGGLAEGMVAGETGFLVPERDVEALATQLAVLLEDPGLRLAMGRRGRAFVDEQFNLATLNRRLVSIYEETTRAHAG